MSAMQKVAWFNLAVVAVTGATVAGLYPVLGNGALGGFGLLGLMGFGPLFLRRKGATVVSDERDRQIMQRAGVITLILFTAVFVPAIAVVLVFFADGETVPMTALLFGLWGGVALLMGVNAVATLAQYSREA